MPSLTLAEAQRRAALLSVERYTVDLDLTCGDATFRSRTTISFGCADPGADTFVDIAPSALRRVTLNGRDLEVADLVDTRLPLSDLSANNLLVVDAEMAYSHDGEGLHRSVDPADNRVYLYGMSFLEAAPRMFACFDQPDLKASYEVTVTAPAGWTVLGNGRATQTSPGRWELAATPPLSTYLVTVVAGPYHSVHTQHDGIVLGLHVKQSLAEHLDAQADEILTVTRQCFDEYHRLFGIRYPFGDYHQAFVPELNAGAMENPGCVTFRDQMIFRSTQTDGERSTRANAVAHEMAHQWFGNLVTMQWWDDLWLNESFAEYMAYRTLPAVTDFRDGWVDFGFVRKRWGMLADQRSSTHPVAGLEAVDAVTALNNFDGISYAKGAAVLKQLATHVGDDVFLGGVVRHLRAHAYGNAAFADLLTALADAGAVDLHGWAEQWLRTSGADAISTAVVDDRVRVTRTRRPAETVRRPHTFRVGAFGERGAGPSALVSLVGDTAEVPLELDGHPVVVADTGDDTWTKVRLDDGSLQNLPAVLPAIDDPVTRAVVWNSLRYAVDDALLDPLRMLELLAAALPGESSDVALGSLLNWAATDLSRRLLPEPVGGPRVAALAAACLAAAASGTGAQIAAARSVAKTAYDVALLAGWLDGTGVPVGLHVDADLRWAALGRLGVLGAADEAEIDGELARDRSAQGVVHAARCRASLPSAEAKERAWELLTRDADVSNYVLYATAEGFWQPSQEVVTAPYLPRFFAEMPGTADLRSGWVVARSVGLAFPATAVSASTVVLAERTLADDLEPGVQRAIGDCTDDLRRALAVRTRWAG
ncbi:MAG: aminopeptidase N [Propionibacteriales bacterium]|nr:aminopeptidase N [Propionibacteriales bacterium]